MPKSLMTEKYMHDCLAQFDEVSAQQFGGIHLRAIEHRAEPLAHKKVSVARLLAHFKEYADNENWFRAYWLFPSLDDLTAEEKITSFNLHQLSKSNEGTQKESDTIKRLLNAFRQIELVSIMLRFIRPDSFGMLTPPVASILDLHSGRDAVQTYLNYLDNLRAIRGHYKFDRAADADMALWVLEYRCNASGAHNSAIKQAFESDEFMLQLRAENLLKPLRHLSSARLASALLGVNNRLAALVGCYALEKNVKQWAQIEGVEKEAKRLAKDRVANKKNPTPSLSDYIVALKQSKTASLESVKQQLGYLHGIRNKVFHAEVKTPTEREIKKLVSAVLEIEQYRL